MLTAHGDQLGRQHDAGVGSDFLCPARLLAATVEELLSAAQQCRLIADVDRSLDPPATLMDSEADRPNPPAPNHS